MSSTGGFNGIHLAQHQGPQEAINRAEAGQRALSNTFALLLREKVRWQRLSLGLLGTTVLTTAALVWMATWGLRTELVVIRVDQLGQEQVLSPVPRRPEKPAQHFVHGVLMAWIEHVRSISNDVIVFTRNWDKVTDYTTTAGMRQLAAFRKEQAIRQQMGRRAQITVGAFLPIGGASNAYTIEWREDVYDRSGQLLLDESGLFKATVRIADFASKTAQDEVELRRKTRNFRNVAGLFVDEVSWTMRPLPPTEER